MPIRNHSEGFDDYRLQRRRMKAKLGPTESVLGFENHALRELEQVEAKEVRDQQLTREVHDFFAAATKQAASIVERVAHDAQIEAGAKVEREMEAFLIDSLSRMNTFVVAALQDRRTNKLAATDVEPTVANIVGTLLDEFRWEGTADVLDKHIGQDPFATAVEDVQRDFRAQIGDHVPGAEEAPKPIEDHLVAEIDDEAPKAEHGDDRLDEPEELPEEPPQARAPTPAAPEKKANKAAAAADRDHDAQEVAKELDRFKSALKALVRQGIMNREEASAAWQARLKALGISMATTP